MDSPIWGNDGCQPQPGKGDRVGIRVTLPAGDLHLRIHCSSQNSRRSPSFRHDPHPQISLWGGRVFPPVFVFICKRRLRITVFPQGFPRVATPHPRRFPPVFFFLTTPPPPIPSPPVSPTRPHQEAAGINFPRPRSGKRTPRSASDPDWVDFEWIRSGGEGTQKEGLQEGHWAATRPSTTIFYCPYFPLTLPPRHAKTRHEPETNFQVWATRGRKKAAKFPVNFAKPNCTRSRRLSDLINSISVFNQFKLHHLE